MAKSKTTSDNQRKSAVGRRSQIKNPRIGAWTKRDTKSVKILDGKTDARLRKAGAGSAASMRRTAKRFSGALKRLADR